MTSLFNRGDQSANGKFQLGIQRSCTRASKQHKIDHLKLFRCYSGIAVEALDVWFGEESRKRLRWKTKAVVYLKPCRKSSPL